jgi:hypothetical protein
MPRKRAVNAILLLTFLSGCSSSTLGSGAEGGSGGSAAAGGTGGRPGEARGGAGGAGGSSGAPAAGGAVGCNDFEASAPFFNCRATYAEERQYVCSLATPPWMMARAGTCGAFDAVYTLYSADAGRTCAYDQQGQLVWAHACGAASVCWGADCASSLGAPAPLPGCDFVEPLCQGVDAGTD